MNATEKTIATKGLNIAYYEYGSQFQPTVLMVHGAGLHARVWGAVIRSISRPCRVIAVDLRGHGRSDKVPALDWEEFATDVVAFIEELNLRDLIGVGHSFGGYVVTHAAIERLEAFKSLVLVDPAIADPSIDRERNFLAGYSDIAQHPIEKRKQTWDSVETMFTYLKDRPPYSLWQTEVLWDYCRYGVTLNSKGEVQLACPPTLETFLYIVPIRHLTEIELASLTLPISVVRTKPYRGDKSFLDFENSFTRGDIGNLLPNATDVYQPDLTHFIPMQRPDLVAQVIDSHLE